MQNSSKKIQFNTLILQWYGLNKRDLPWRNTILPYPIWLSEIILQQTRVSQGMPYFLRFLDAFPDIFALANAEEEKILRLWQGLGYYSRARNLHQTAKIIVQEHSGIFPESYEKLLKLKGIGPYTAAAIASFAYNEKVAVVDGNVFRVLARFYGIDYDIQSTTGIKFFRQLAQELIELSPNAAEHNQAMMEFGALQCVPKNPDCGSCPLKSACVAHNHQLIDVLPVKLKKITKKTRYFNYIVLSDEQKIFMHQRSEKDIWQGLFEFLLIESDSFMENEALKNQIGVKKELTFVGFSKIYTHTLSHQKLFIRFAIYKSENKFKPNESLKSYKKYNKAEIDALPKPILINKFLNDYFF